MQSRSYHPALSAPILAQQDGAINPNYESTYSDHAPICARLPLPKPLVTSEGELQELVVISWNVLEQDETNGCANEMNRSPMCHENPEQQKRRHDRIAIALGKMAKENNASVITLQEIAGEKKSKVNRDDALFYKISKQLGDQWKFIEDDSSVITFYRADRLKPKKINKSIPDEIKKSLHKDERSKFYNAQMMGFPATTLFEPVQLNNQSIAIHNYHPGYTRSIINNENLIKYVLNYADLEEQKDRPLTNAAVGDFNADVGYKQNSITNLAPMWFNKGVQGCQRVDGFFYQQHHVNKPNETSGPKQSFTQSLNVATGKIHTQNELDTPINAIKDTNSKNEIEQLSRLYISMQVEETDESKSLKEYEKSLRSKFKNNSIRVRPAINGLNEQGIGIEVSQELYEAIQKNEPDKSPLQFYNPDQTYYQISCTNDHVLWLYQAIQQYHNQLTHVPSAKEIKSDDELRNVNSFEYLRNVSDKIPDSLCQIGIFDYVKKQCNQDSLYSSDIPYGNWYTEFLLTLEEIVLSLENNSPIPNLKNVNLDDLDNLIDSLYSNRNYALERSYEMIHDDIRTIRQTDEKALENAIHSRFTDKTKEKRSAGENKLTPTAAGSFLGRVAANIGSEFKPMMTTSQPSEVHLNYKNPSDPQQIRFGTQGQIVDYQSRVNPLFMRWLKIKDKKQEKLPIDHIDFSKYSIIKSDIIPTENNIHQFNSKTNISFIRVNNELYLTCRYLNVCEKLGEVNNNLSDAEFQKQYHDIIQHCALKIQKQAILAKANDNYRAENKIDHLYINNLSRSGKSFEKKREVSLTDELHHIEDHNKNVAIITLPADDGFLDHHLANQREISAQKNYQNIYDRILSIANGTSNETNAKDFHISLRIKKLLYGLDGNSYNKNKEDTILRNLLTDSFQKLGFTPESKLSQADIQAVYFHFIKFELTNFIIATLKPKTFNFSCKDAIDRGGVSSAYYNLINSIERDNPISRDEFEKLLHGAPALVKGRGMNQHTHLIWNTIDAYVETHKNDPKKMPSWLPEWRNQNSLPGSMPYYLNELTRYQTERSAKADYLSLFGKAKKMDKELKTGVANRLIKELSEQNNNRQSNSKALHFKPNSELEAKALKDGKLGAAVKAMEKKGLIVVEQPTKTLRNSNRSPN